VGVIKVIKEDLLHVEGKIIKRHPLTLNQRIMDWHDSLAQRTSINIHFLK